MKVEQSPLARAIASERRSAASKRAWLRRKAMAAARDAGAPLAEGGRYAPGGPQWGSKPLPQIDMSIPAILARLRAREAAE